MDTNKNLHRSKFIDIIKGIAIILVVLGHLIQYGNGLDYVVNGYFFDNLLFKIIYSFHMPLFMLISGYLFYFSITKKDFKELLKGRFFGIVVPIVSWGVLVNIIFLIINRNFDIYQFYSIWFLWAILFNSLLVIIINKLFKDSVILYVLIGIIMLIIPDFYNLHLFKYMYPYFVLGYFFNKSFSTKNFQLNIIFLFSLLLYVPLMFFWDRSSYIYVSGVNIMANPKIIDQLLIDIYRWVVGGIGSVLVLSLFFIIYKKYELNNSLLNIIEKIGKFSLGIYIISNYIFIYFFPKYIYQIKVENSFINVIYMFFMTIIIITISYLTTKLMFKIKIIKKIFFGNR